MSQNPNIGNLVGVWTYRSFLSDPALAAPFAGLEFGRANLRIDEAPAGVLTGQLYDTGFALNLSGSLNGGYPSVVRFQGRGVVGGEQWIYDYLGFVVPAWPNGIDQRPSIVGSIVRTLPHSGGKPGTIAPAGVVCSWIAVRQDNPAT